MSKPCVAIAATYNKINYGTVLQAYATQEVLKELGCEFARTIDTSGLSTAIASGRRSYYLEHLFDIGLYRAKFGFIEHRARQKINRNFGKKIERRRKAFDTFVSSHFIFTERANSFESLVDITRSYDAVVVGSDQQWLPVNIAGDFYTLSWVPEGVRKLSFATSFGVSDLPVKYLKRTGEFLSDYDAISVREETGADLVERSTGKRPAVVCDPTMLLTRDQWGTIASSATSVVPDKPYILCYFLGTNIWNRECAIRLAKQTGCNIVSLAHLDEYVPFDDSYADYYPWDAGPAEWLALVSNARYVLSDSFHGTVFSNIFGKPFVSFRRHENMGLQSTNSRLDTLLMALGNPGRICEHEDDFDAIISTDVDFDIVSRRIKAYREKSASWLKGALSLGGDSK